MIFSTLINDSITIFIEPLTKSGVNILNIKLIIIFDC